MKTALILDTYYLPFLKSLSLDQQSTYEAELAFILAQGFGTFDAYSFYLRRENWAVCDVIANHNSLQRMWAREHGVTSAPSMVQVVMHQIDAFRPDVVFLQDLSFLPEENLRQLRQRYTLAAQCSCPMPPRENLQHLDVIFTSFPHYVEAFRALGIPCVEYLPLAYDPRMSGGGTERDIDILFVGGVGEQSHWAAGTRTLERLAEVFGLRFQWYGYGCENLPNNSALRACYRGSAWGRTMYRLYERARIVVNRHGEVAAGYANNLRLYEATGSGALLVTEAASNLNSLFPAGTCATYTHPQHLVDIVTYYLAHEEERARIAAAGHIHCLRYHTYRERIPHVAKVLTNYRVHA